MASGTQRGRQRQRRGLRQIEKWQEEDDDKQDAELHDDHRADVGHLTDEDQRAGGEMAEYTASNKPAKRRRRIRTQKAPTEPEVSAIARRNARALKRSKSREETDAAAEQETETPTDGGEATETEAEAGSDTDSTNGGSRDMAGTADDEWAIWYSVKEGKAWSTATASTRQDRPEVEEKRQRR